MERVAGRCGRIRVQRVAAFVLLGERIGRRRSGIDVAKRTIRVKCPGKGSVAVKEEGGIMTRVDGSGDGAYGG